MTAAVSDTNLAHLLPIGLGVAGGTFLGGAETAQSMRFLRRYRRRNAAEVANELLSAPRPEGDWHPAPGFGSLYGGADALTNTLASRIVGLQGSRTTLLWAEEFVDMLRPEGLGWLLPGLAAAVFTDLGVHPRFGAQLFQLAVAPGILAHSGELISKPVTAMPWVEQENYRVLDKEQA
jgi:citrate synthase